MTTKSRRTVDYSTLEELRLDAEALAAGPYTTVGNWTYGQILQHLAQAMHASIDGFPFGAPWYMRLAAPLVKNSVLTNQYVLRAMIKLDFLKFFDWKKSQCDIQTL